MKKKDKLLLNAALDKALAPPKQRNRAALDSLLNEYDDSSLQETTAVPEFKRTVVPEQETTAVLEYRSTAVPQASSISADSLNIEINQLTGQIIDRTESSETSTQNEHCTGVPEYRSTPVLKLGSTGVAEHSTSVLPELTNQVLPQLQITTEANAKRTEIIPTASFYRKANETVDNLDRQLSPAESKILDHLIRLSVGFNRDWCRVRITTLMDRSGYRSDKTVRAAIHGLILKGIIERRNSHNSPLGDEYRILDYSGTGVPEYRGTAVKNTPVLEAKITGELNTNNKEKTFDDEAFAEFNALLKKAVLDITEKEPTKAERHKWEELADVLVTELKIAAARTETISSVPAFFAEHLRRRLFKKDKRQLEAEAQANVGPTTEKGGSKQDAKECPDCKGTMFYYPNGYEKGVERCKHEKLLKSQFPNIEQGS